MKFISKDQMEIVGNRKVWFIISAVVILICAAFMIFRGFDLDTDFAGGISLQYDLHTTLDKKELDSIRKLIDDNTEFTVTSVQKSGDDASCVIIKAHDIDTEKLESEYQKVFELLNDKYGAPVEETETEPESDVTEPETEEVASPYNIVTPAEAEAVEETENADETETVEETEPVEEAETVEEAESEKADGKLPVEKLEETRIGASVSNEIKRSAVIATVIAVALMLVYITIRFEFRSAIAAILCLIHDIFIVVASYAVFGIPVSANIIAVILTILGYSINATIILFDRVRENRKMMGRTDFGVIINISSRQTLLRSVNTTVTTLLTIGMVYILGVHSIKEFALPIIVGIVAGLYSSVFLSGSIWYMLTPKRVNKD